MARNSHHLFQTKAPIWGLVVVFVVLVLSLVFFSSGWSAKTEGPPSCSIKSNTRGLFSDFVSSPRIIVTGGAGFIGSHLVAELVQLYSVDQVVVIDSLVRGKLENLEEIKDRSQLTVCETNLEDPLNAKKYVKGADIVFHLPDGNDCLPEVFQSTILSNKNVLNAAIESGAKRYFYTETTCNFPKRSQMPMPEQSSSGESQLWEETEAARVAAQDGKIDVGVLRFYNVYGDHTEFAEPTSQLLPALIYRALNGGNRKGDLLVGGHSGDFLHVSDAVSALLALLRVNSPIPFHQTIQIGSGERVRILELAEYISEIAFSDFGIQYHNRRLKVLPEWSKKPTVNSDQIADNQAAKNLLGWEPKVTWKAGVKMLVYWISDQMDFLPFLPLLKPSYAYYEIPSTPKFCAFWYEKPSTSSYSYYYEIFSAIEKHPAVSLFSNLRRSFCVDQDELVIILPSNIMTKEEPIANAVKDIQRKVRDLNFKKKAIFAVFLNKVYKELQIKIDLLLPLLNIHNSTVLVFSWSPHAITWKRTRIPMQTHSRMFFYFLPFAVNLHQFDLVSENMNGKYKYDLYFAGDTDPGKYRDRKQIADQFPRLTTEHGLRFNNPDVFLKFSKYKSELAKAKMCLGTVGMPQDTDLVSTRYFETMASGTTLLLCEKSPLSNVYKAAGIIDGETALMFDGVDDFSSKIVNISKSITPSHNPYKHILENAKQMATRLHSWKNRASFFLKTVIDHMPSRKQTII